jgi:hypothetical protein
MTRAGQQADLVVSVDCPRELRLCRQDERDGEAMRWKGETVWMPEEETVCAGSGSHGAG